MSQLPADAACGKCGAAATLMCQRCMDFYCGSDCQILDWKEHKTKCYQMPQLVPIKKLLRGGSGVNNLNDSMRRPHGAGGHNDSMRRGSCYSMARNPLPTDDEYSTANKAGVAKQVLREDKDFVMRPKVAAAVPPPPAPVVEPEIALKKLPIVNGCVVYITRVLTHAEVFISAASCKEYAVMFAALAPKCAAYASDDLPPAKGDFVLVAGDGNCFRAEILNSDAAPNAFRVLNIDTGVTCTRDIPLRLLRKLNNAARAPPIQVQRIRLIYVESIPQAVPGNKALAALEKCRANAVDFAVKFEDEKRSEGEVVDLLFLNKDPSTTDLSLSKKLLPLLFEKSESSAMSSAAVVENGGSIKQHAPKQLAGDAMQQEMPPKVPANVAVPDLKELASVAESPLPPQPKLQHFDMLNLGAMTISSDTSGAATVASPKMYTLTDLKVVPITVGDNVPILVLDASSIFQGYITASDFGNKSFLAKMEAYLASVSKYCKSRALENIKASGGAGYTPKPNEICLAVYADDGEWYRALCIEQPKIPENGKDEVFRVMFLDYGNICKVSKRETLPITEELMFPANANTCFVEGLATKEQRTAFLKAVVTSPLISCNVSKRSDVEDAYTIEVDNLEKLIAG